MRNRRALQVRLGDAVSKRRQKNWTQDDFAAHIDMNRSQYGFFEKGKRDPQLTTIERVAAGLGVEVWTLLREAEESD